MEILTTAPASAAEAVCTVFSAKTAASATPLSLTPRRSRNSRSFSTARLTRFFAASSLTPSRSATLSMGAMNKWERGRTGMELK